MKNGRTLKALKVAFHFLGPQDHRHQTRVSYIEPGQTDDSRLCVIIPSYSDKARWRVIETTPEKYHKYVQMMEFDSQDQAAQFVYHLIKTTEDVAAEKPLPQNVTTYLERRARDLRDESESLRNQFLNVAIERSLLAEFAQQNRIPAVEAYTDGTVGDLVRKLLTFKVEGDEVPFISEISLYERIGKQDARAFRGILKAVCELIAPDVVNENYH